MMDYYRIEIETETNRTARALRALVPHARLPLDKGAVQIVVAGPATDGLAGQCLLSLLVHLLARMKGIVSRVSIAGPVAVSRLPSVPLNGVRLDDSLSRFLSRLGGPRSDFHTEFHVGQDPYADVRVVIGGDGGESLLVGCDAWRALFGSFAVRSSWQDETPLGAYMAASIAAAEILKRLIRINFGLAGDTEIVDGAFSLLNLGVDERASAGPSVADLELGDVAIVGAGAGGTAALYALASFPRLSGRVTVVEPGVLKESSLGRYLMTDYEQAHDHVHKLESLRRFIGKFAPSLALFPEAKPWHELAPRRWGIVVSTVDNPEARWSIQRSQPNLILDGGVVGTIYAVLRVVPGGWCLECKHPPNPAVTFVKRAARWGLTLDEVKLRHRDRVPISRSDLLRLAEVQNRPVETFLSLEGVAFDRVPELTECGETPLSISVPSQAPVLPFTTTAAGVLIAAELTKEICGLGSPLNNYFDHDLRHRPRAARHRFKPSLPNCGFCSGHR